jgi:hypothetical protein
MPTKVMQLKSVQFERGFAGSGALVTRPVGAGRGLEGEDEPENNQDQKLLVC